MRPNDKNYREWRDMTADWNEEFEQITSNLQMEWDPEPAIGAVEINQAIMSVNEVASFMGRLLSMGLQDPDEMLFINEDLADAIQELVMLSDSISAELCGCTCPECKPCECDDDGETLCDSCIALYELDDEDDEGEF